MEEGVEENFKLRPNSHTPQQESETGGMGLAVSCEYHPQMDVTIEIDYSKVTLPISWVRI